MTDVNETVAVAQNSSTLASALVKLTSDIVAAKKSGATGEALIAAIGAAAVADLVGAIASVAGIGAEIAAEPVGVAEAFALAGFEVARSLTGK